jgi:hypothetical protein
MLFCQNLVLIFFSLNLPDGTSTQVIRFRVYQVRVRGVTNRKITFSGIVITIFTVLDQK